MIEGAPIYDRDWQLRVYSTRYPFEAPQGMFYPPATALVLAPLGALPFRLAQFCWFALMIATIVLGARALLRLARPGAPNQVWLLTAALMLMSACVRWGMTPLQGAPLIMGLLCLFLPALHEGHKTLSACIATFVMSFKFTLALPFLALLLLYRRYGAIALALGVWLLLNVIGFARLGGMDVFHQYRANLALVELPGDINTPDPWELVSVPRSDWIYLFDGITRNLKLSRLLTSGLTVVVGLWLALAALRSPARPTLRMTAVFTIATVCLGSLNVYHHVYDLSPIVPPLVLLAFRRREFALPAWIEALLIPVIAIAALYPIALGQKLARGIFGPHGSVLTNLSFPIAISLALLSALAATSLVRRSDSMTAK